MNLEYLIRACGVCERNAIVGALQNVLFENGRIHAFSGSFWYQAPSPLEDKSDTFSVNATKLSSALRACSDKAMLSTTKDFLVVKNGPFTVRVKKIIPEGSPGPLAERLALPPEAKNTPATGLLEAMRRVAPFISTDASRPWSVALLIDSGYAWATNNLAIARSPVALKWKATSIPAPVADFLTELPSLDHYHIDKQRITISSGKSLIRFPCSATGWPDMQKFFEKFPKKIPAVPKEMKEAAAQVERFADRYIDLSAKALSSKTDATDTDYELEVKGNKGKFSAGLLSLILAHATHIDFSRYPLPIFFKGESIEGTAIGLKE